MCSIPYLSCQYVIQLGHCSVENDLANLEVLHLSHAVDHFLRLLAERIARALVL